MLDKVLAKYHERKGVVYKETLIEHTEYILEVLDKMKLIFPEFSKEFWELAFWMCLFHDAGKITDNFQNALNGNREENIRHELLSGALLFFANKRFFKENALFTVAVYSHHKPLNEELFDKDQFKELKLRPQLIESWFKFVKTKINSDFDISVTDIYKLGEMTTEAYVKLFLSFYSTNKVNWKKKDRLEYINIKAVLNMADWAASGHFNPVGSLSYTQDDLLNALRKKVGSNDPVSFRDFQLKGVVNQNVLAIAPTGSGKTEAALLWASQKKEYNKILYCLPTRVTSNAIYERLKAYFGSDSCSIVHSSALLYQKEINQDFDSREYLRDRTFFRNITVCTIDQLLTQGFNLGFWEVKSFHCSNARIIIDEIHLYSPYTLALILRTITYLRENFNTQFFIMSATMPTKLCTLLTEALGGEEKAYLVQDKELLDKSRNTFEVRKITIQENVKEIERAIHENSKVLVVVNTVDQAINLYRDLKEQGKENGKLVICFHSRFIQKDRHEKEQAILNAEKKGKDILLIATQVVEVSLDIDFDILFTENAPIDAIIQRAGRVNRKRIEGRNSKVIVHSHSSVSEEVIYTESDILKNTFEVLAEKNDCEIKEEEFLVLVDRVYEDIDVTEKGTFKEGWKAYEDIQSTFNYLGDCPLGYEGAMTRDGLDTVNVIPGCFYEELYQQEKLYKTKFELTIRKEKYMTVRKKEDKDRFKYVEYAYDKEVGLIFPSKETDKKVNSCF